MRKFSIQIQRTVRTVETVTRVIEAATEAEAFERADQLGDSFNRSCPEDAGEESAPDCGGWYSVGPATVTDEPADLAAGEAI